MNHSDVPKVAVVPSSRADALPVIRGFNRIIVKPDQVLTTDPDGKIDVLGLLGQVKQGLSTTFTGTADVCLFIIDNSDPANMTRSVEIRIQVPQSDDASPAPANASDQAV